MRSNEVAKLAGVTVRTLRHYHQLGLLPEPPRSANGYRDYTAADVARVLRVKRLAALGFPLARIGAILDELDAPDPSPASALEELDRELALEIERLEEQRRTIALLKRERLDVDLPVRAARISKELVGAFDDDTLPRPSESERAALLLMANLYDERSFAEVERISEALVERGLLPAMRAIDVRTAALAPDAAESEIEALAEEVLHVFMQVTDVVDSENWDRDYTFAEQLILAYSSQEFNPAQRALYERLAIGLEALFKNSAKPLDPDATS